MGSRRSETELVRLRKIALARAEHRKERATTVHLLAAVSSQPGPAQELLAARRLDEDKLLRAARSFDEDGSEPFGNVLDGARAVARRAAVPSRQAFASSRGAPARAAAAPPPGGVHVLVVLLSNRRLAAYRALSQLGVDIPRLRTAAMQLALGVVAPPRSVERGRRAQQQRSEAASPEQSKRVRKRSGTAVQVPLFPGLPGGRTPKAPDRSGPSIEPGRSKRPLPVPSRPPVGPPARPATRQPTMPPVEPAVPKARPAQQSAAPGPNQQERQAARRASRQARRDELERFRIDPTRYPTLAALGRNLTLAAASEQLDPVIGRDEEIEQTLDILAKRHANSAVLVGHAGVGKSSVARGLALRFAADADRESARLLIELPLTELLAGTSARGALAERAAAIRTEVREAEGRIVLFIDEVHELCTGAADELMAEIKAALAGGEFPLVGATTLLGHRRVIEGDAVLARRLSVVDIDEPDEADSFFTLRAVADQLERHHGLRYEDEAIASAVSWSIRYLPGRALPDKAVSILDLAGAKLGRRRTGSSSGAPRSVAAEAAVRGTVDRQQVAEIIAELADVPAERLMQTDHERMLQMEELLGERVVGHPEALKRIAAVLRRNAAGLRGRRPIGTLLLLGPTGVGKTETAKAIAEALFHSPDAMTRLDMSEYAEPHAVARLIGAPPGYVGHEAGGELTESVRRRPYQVVLLDEIEKAHRDVLEAFLQVFDEGRLTDGRGRTVDYTNTVMVMTSNLGADQLRAAGSERRVGFGASRSAMLDQDQARDIALKAARQALPPELYNRIDEVIFYRALARDDVRQIAVRLLGGLSESLELRGIRLDVEEDVIDELMQAGGYDPEFGARPMRRAISRFIEAPLADLILQRELVEGSVAMVHLDDGAIAVDVLPGGQARTA